MAWGLFLSHSVRNRKGSAGPGLVAPTLLSVGKQQTAGRCVAEQRLTKRRLGAALGLQAACPALEQQFSRFMSRVPKELWSCLSIFTTFALKTDAKSVH